MILLIIKSLFLLHSWALDTDVVWQWPVCKDQVSQWTPTQIRNLKDSKKFFTPHDPLNMYSKAIDKINLHNQKYNACFKSQLHQPHPAALLIDQIQKKMTSQIQKDLNIQQNLIENAIYCTEKNVPSKSKSECEEYLSQLNPELSRRLQFMRAAKSLAQNNTKQPQHDIPFTNDLFSSIFPTLWKKEAIQTMSPLNQEELKLRQNLASEGVTPEQAEKIYYNLLSTTPVLMFFDDHVNNDNINQSLKKLQLQNNFDQQNNLMNPQQELFMMSGYVQQALQELPESQRGDACLLVSEIYKNLKIQYEITPLYYAAIGVPISLIAPPIKIWGRSIGVLGKFSITSSVTFGQMSLDNYKKYQTGVQFCSTQMMSNDVKNSKICQFEALNKLYKNSEKKAAMNFILGASTMSLVKVYKARYSGQ